MDVSVVIPSYNRADLLPFTLDSVLAQTIPPKEVIVVDDGSSDDTLAIIGRYGARIRVIAIENSGSIVARNVGLRAAVTTRVAFCDSDDLWMPDFLQKMDLLFRASQETKVAYSNFRIVQDNIWSTNSKFDEAPAGYWDGLRMVGDELGVFDQPIVDRVVRWQPFFASNLVVDRVAMLEAGGWDEGVGRTVGDDFGTVLRLAGLHPFGVVFAPAVGIRKHAENFSANVQAMNLGDANILEYVLASQPSLAPLATLIRDSMARRRRDALDSAFSDGDFVAVRAVYKLLPKGSVTFSTMLKAWIAGLPEPIALNVAPVLTRIRTTLR